jgi:hypothetical protein
LSADPEVGGITGNVQDETGETLWVINVSRAQRTWDSSSVFHTDYSLLCWGPIYTVCSAELTLFVTWTTARTLCRNFDSRISKKFLRSKWIYHLQHGNIRNEQLNMHKNVCSC